MNYDGYESQPGQSLPPSAKKEGRDLLSAWQHLGLLGSYYFAIIATVLIVCSSTVHAAPQPTPTLAATNGPTQLGQPITNFVKTYGQPDSDGEFRQKTLLVYGASGWDITPVSKDGSLVVDIYDYNTDGKGWANIGEAAKTCEAYMPKDAKFQKTINYPADSKQGIPPATERVYTSSSLASLFPASAFSDKAGKSVPPGTFVIDYSGDNANNQRIQGCAVTLAVYASGLIDLLA